ncbi:hypothetical protein CDCA_CDCA04G1303 [Cyanidium caldarium]|uniref:Nuclear pore complex protein Nup85 n=1 Tax=Cyanidium caldarium TaxID=2771 RepID=A0AAV9ITU7_CYACA|nr:hypothetical protein CDCA_CDCA04G1303 [Cyanidium caldarium]
MGAEGVSGGNNLRHHADDRIREWRALVVGECEEEDAENRGGAPKLAGRAVASAGQRLRRGDAEPPPGRDCWSRILQVSVSVTVRKWLHTNAALRERAWCWAGRAGWRSVSDWDGSWTRVQALQFSSVVDVLCGAPLCNVSECALEWEEGVAAETFASEGPVSRGNVGAAARTVEAAPTALVESVDEHALPFAECVRAYEALWRGAWELGVAHPEANSRQHQGSQGCGNLGDCSELARALHIVLLAPRRIALMQPPAPAGLPSKRYRASDGSPASRRRALSYRRSPLAMLAAALAALRWGHSDATTCSGAVEGHTVEHLKWQLATDLMTLWRSEGNVDGAEAVASWLQAAASSANSVAVAHCSPLSPSVTRLLSALLPGLVFDLRCTLAPAAARGTCASTPAQCWLESIAADMYTLADHLIYTLDQGVAPGGEVPPCSMAALVPHLQSVRQLAADYAAAAAVAAASDATACLPGATDSDLAWSLRSTLGGVVSPNGVVPDAEGSPCLSPSASISVDHSAYLLLKRAEEDSVASAVRLAVSIQRRDPSLWRELHRALASTAFSASSIAWTPSTRYRLLSEVERLDASLSATHSVVVPLPTSMTDTDGETLAPTLRMYLAAFRQEHFEKATLPPTTIDSMPCGGLRLRRPDLRHVVRLLFLKPVQAALAGKQHTSEPDWLAEAGWSDSLMPAMPGAWGMAPALAASMETGAARAPLMQALREFREWISPSAASAAVRESVDCLLAHEAGSDMADGTFEDGCRALQAALEVLAEYGAASEMEALSPFTACGRREWGTLLVFDEELVSRMFCGCPPCDCSAAVASAADTRRRLGRSLTLVERLLPFLAGAVPPRVASSADTIECTPGDHALDVSSAVYIAADMLRCRLLWVYLRATHVWCSDAALSGCGERCFRVRAHRLLQQLFGGRHGDAATLRWESTQAAIEGAFEAQDDAQTFALLRQALNATNHVAAEEAETTPAALLRWELAVWRCHGLCMETALFRQWHRPVSLHRLYWQRLFGTDGALPITTLAEALLQLAPDARTPLGAEDMWPVVPAGWMALLVRGLAGARRRQTAAQTFVRHLHRVLTTKAEVAIPGGLSPSTAPTIWSATVVLRLYAWLLALVRDWPGQRAGDVGDVPTTAPPAPDIHKLPLSADERGLALAIYRALRDAPPEP